MLLMYGKGGYPLSSSCDMMHGMTNLDEVLGKTNYQYKGTNPAHTVNLVIEADVTFGYDWNQKQGWRN